jgi:hypothetical protein
VHTRRKLGDFHSHLGDVHRVLFIPGTDYIAALGSGKLLRVWDVRGLLSEADADGAGVREVRDG